jgi:HEPN domain-containing protein
MVTTRYFDQRERFTEAPDVFIYNQIETDFRYKVGYAIADLFEFMGRNSDDQSLIRTLWERMLVRALGVPGRPSGPLDFLVNANFREFFIGLEVALHCAAIAVSRASFGRGQDCVDYIQKTVGDINTLFRYYALGFELVDVKDAPPIQLIRKDSEYTHAETVKPALSLLTMEGFEDADKQFRDAHREFQEGNYDDAITDANAAVETVLKVVLGRIDGTAKELLKAAADDGYFPSFFADSINQWINLFLDLPAVSNRYGDAHGKGVKVDEHEMERFARLALNLAATHILFIIDEYERRK